MDKYYMVHRMDGGSPSKIHHIRQDAVDEAERLAKRNPDVKFVILEATDYVCCTVLSPVWEKAKEEE